MNSVRKIATQYEETVRRVSEEKARQEKLARRRSNSLKRLEVSAVPHPSSPSDSATAPASSADASGQSVASSLTPLRSGQQPSAAAATTTTATVTGGAGAAPLIRPSGFPAQRDQSSSEVPTAESHGGAEAVPWQSKVTGSRSSSSVPSEASSSSTRPLLPLARRAQRAHHLSLRSSQVRAASPSAPAPDEAAADSSGRRSWLSALQDLLSPVPSALDSKVPLQRRAAAPAGSTSPPRLRPRPLSQNLTGVSFQPTRPARPPPAEPQGSLRQARSVETLVRQPAAPPPRAQYHVGYHSLVTLRPTRAPAPPREQPIGTSQQQQDAAQEQKDRRVLSELTEVRRLVLEGRAAAAAARLQLLDGQLSELRGPAALRRLLELLCLESPDAEAPVFTSCLLSLLVRLLPLSDSGMQDLFAPVMPRLLDLALPRGGSSAAGSGWDERALRTQTAALRVLAFALQRHAGNQRAVELAMAAREEVPGTGAPAAPDLVTALVELAAEELADPPVPLQSVSAAQLHADRRCAALFVLRSIAEQNRAGQDAVWRSPRVRRELPKLANDSAGEVVQAGALETLLVVARGNERVQRSIVRRCGEPLLVALLQNVGARQEALASPSSALLLELMQHEDAELLARLHAAPGSRHALLLALGPDADAFRQFHAIAILTLLLRGSTPESEARRRDYSRAGLGLALERLAAETSGEVAAVARQLQRLLGTPTSPAADSPVVQSPSGGGSGGGEERRHRTHRRHRSHKSHRRAVESQPSLDEPAPALSPSYTANPGADVGTTKAIPPDSHAEERRAKHERKHKKEKKHRKEKTEENRKEKEGKKSHKKASKTQEKKEKIVRNTETRSS